MQLAGKVIHLPSSLSVSFTNMLSRRHLRIKVLQALYAFFQSGANDIAAGENQLVKSTDKLYELYIYQLSFLVKLVDFANNRLEEAKRKFYPTEEEKNPNTRFVENAFIRQIAGNKDFNRWSSKLKINWVDDINLVHRFYNEIRQSEEYSRYMSSPDHSYSRDKEIIAAIVMTYLPDYELLRSFYEDKSIYWADEDFDNSVIMLIKTIKLFREQYGPDYMLPGLFKTDGDEGETDEDRQFMLKLFRYSILRSDENEGLVESQADNWELDRIALMDMIIMKMALTELMIFPSIPIKVTINEYIEISKSYSSVKSKLFINGILDKLVIKLKDEGKIHKAGRGLME
jgi:N utilization substance protein B